MLFVVSTEITVRLKCSIMLAMPTKLLFVLFLLYHALQINAQHAGQLYKEAALAESGLSENIFKTAYRGFQQIESARKNRIAIIDYSLPSVQKRLFIIQLDEKQLLKKIYVAHGKYTGQNKARHFSNKPGSKKSSLGFYLTGKTYQGKHGYSLKLHGLEPGLNDHALERYIVMHGAWYVNQHMIEKYGRLGRSWGCPAVAKDEAKPVIDLLKEGAVLFIYAKGYAEQSKLLGNTDKP